MSSNYEVIADAGRPIKMWTKGVPVEREAVQQLRNIAALPFIHEHIAVMPDVHLGKGATVGSVIATKGAIVPAAVGVDIGCGMCAAMTNLSAIDLPDSLTGLRRGIEAAVPVGQASHKQPARGADRTWYGRLKSRYTAIEDKHPGFAPKASPALQIGTLGGGNHFIELCLDQVGQVWIMLHSGSRNVGNKIGTYFISKAREEMERLCVKLPDRDLAYLDEGSPLFRDYVEAVGWAQDYAAENRRVMLEAVLAAVQAEIPHAAVAGTIVSCHHNYIAREHHFGEAVWVTRKGALRAGDGDLGIIPGSMGAKSFIVRGKGNPESFCSCSHGAGRKMSRAAAKKMFSLDDHAAATAGVECRKDAGVLDETPGAYKPIDDVMAAQTDLIEVVHTLRQVLCVKG